MNRNTASPSIFAWDRESLMTYLESGRRSVYYVTGDASLSPSSENILEIRPVSPFSSASSAASSGELYVPESPTPSTVSTSSTLYSWYENLDETIYGEVIPSNYELSIQVVDNGEVNNRNENLEDYGMIYEVLDSDSESDQVMNVDVAFNQNENPAAEFDLVYEVGSDGEMYEVPINDAVPNQEPNNAEAIVVSNNDDDDDELTNFVMPDFICSICLKCYLPRNPRQLHCGHNFCFGCIKKWMETKCQCPMCHQFTAKENMLIKSIY